MGIGDMNGNGLTLRRRLVKGTGAARERPIKPLLNLRICFDSAAKTGRGPISRPTPVNYCTLRNRHAQVADAA